MEIRNINPWKWQDERSYSQAVEVKNVEGTLYCSGQAAIDENGKSSTADMKSQLIKAIQNLEEVIKESGYQCNGIVRLNIFTTSTDKLMKHFDIFQNWIARHNIKQSLTVLEVNALFETLCVELEATVVK